MDRKTYVKRLKKMIERFPNTTCSHCPAGKYYNECEDNAVCRICQNFVKLKYRDPYYNPENKLCPCCRPNAETAIKRALKYIALYETKHGELK